MFQHDALIRSYFKADDYTIQKLNKGLTNDNYLITVGNQRFVIRIPKNDAAQIVNFAHEAKALKLVKAADLDVDTLYYDQKTGIKITRYVDDLKTFDEYQGSDKIQRTALLMKRLHGLKQTIGYAFDPVARCLQYARHVSHPLIDEHRAQAIIEAIEELTYEPTLCHNDWVSGNICFTQHKDVLIDYEYAGDNDPLFDVMSFITENDLSPKDRQDFYNAYFGHPLSVIEKHRLDLYEDFHNLLWCTWAEMMYESRQDPVYQQIARGKLSQFNHEKGSD